PGAITFGSDEPVPKLGAVLGPSGSSPCPPVSARDAAVEARSERLRAPFEREAVSTPARLPARDCQMPPILFTRGTVGPACTGVQVRVELRLTRARVLGCLGAEGEVVQRPRLAGELACLAALRAGAGAAVAASERLLELPLAALEAAPAVRVRALNTIARRGAGR